MTKYSESLLGVMQGRLLPKYKGRYQAHPLGYWQKEFSIAKSVGLNCIEFILDFNDYEKNPLMSKEGIEQIQSVSDETGVVVKTICADYFMEAPIHDHDEEVKTKSQSVLRSLLINVKELNVTDIVIPCVDHSSLSNSKANERFIESLNLVLPLSEKYGINLSLETDLAPEPFAELINRFDSKRVTVNYDTGNSASLGYDPTEELNCYGDRISDIHIKDRVLGGGPVELGKGDCNFDAFFKALDGLNYRGPIIMQAYRDDEGVSIFKSQLDWLKESFL